VFHPQVNVLVIFNAILLVLRCLDCRAYRLVSHIANCRVERMIGG
jgi:hypothetical protein